MSGDPGELRRIPSLVVIGSSFGGLDALSAVLAHLPGAFAVPVAVVQHRAEGSDLLAELLQECTPVAVVDVLDKQPIGPGIFVAPPAYHLVVERSYFGLSTEEPVRHSQPSIDLALESAADSYGEGVVGIVLTGANADGAEGLRRVAARGGTAIVQDPSTAAARSMPRAALEAVPGALVLRLPEIGAWLAALAPAGDHG